MNAEPILALIGELYSTVGRLTVENARLRDALAAARKPETEDTDRVH